jgi:adenylate cyclase
MKLDDGETIRNNAMETRSEAEQVMLLYRNSKKPQPRDPLWNKLLQ